MQELSEDFVRSTEALVGGEQNLIANLANFSALYMEFYKPHWCGFYLVQNNELVLGPFQGPVACTRITTGKGVCGKAAATNMVQNVENVHEFDGHIACSPSSNSELVIPLLKNGKVWGVFDVDRTQFGFFDESHIEILIKALSALKP